MSTAIRSALDQPGVDVEVIVIDDASTDGSAEVVRVLAASDPRVRAILHRSNAGHIATYNEGLAQAAGDYVVLLSADDALTPGSLARATALLEANPSVGLVYGDHAVFVDEPPSVPEKMQSWTIWSGNEWIEERCRSGRNCVASPEAIMRTSVQHAIGGYDAALPHSGDLEMWLRAAAVSDVGRINGPPQAYYRVHPDSMMRTSYPMNSLADFEQSLSAFETALVGPRTSVSNGDALFAAARKAVAACALGYARSAYDHGRVSDEPVEDYMAFALRVSPEVNKTWRWRVLARYAEANENRVNRGLVAALRVAGELKSRV